MNQHEARGETSQVTSQPQVLSSRKWPGGEYDSVAVVSLANRMVGGQYFAFRAHGMSGFDDGQTGAKLSFCVVSNSIGTEKKIK